MPTDDRPSRYLDLRRLPHPSWSLPRLPQMTAPVLSLALRKALTSFRGMTQSCTMVTLGVSQVREVYGL